MILLALFQLLVGIGVLLTVWSLGPFVLDARSPGELILMAALVLCGPTLLVLGSVMLFLRRTQGAGGTIGLVGSILSSAWLTLIVGHVIWDQLHRPLNRWLLLVALVLFLVTLGSLSAAIRLYRGSHTRPFLGSQDQETRQAKP